MEPVCCCGFWSSRQEVSKAPGFAKPEAGWDLRYCKKILLGLHQLSGVEAEGNKNTASIIWIVAEHSHRSITIQTIRLMEIKYRSAVNFRSTESQAKNEVGAVICSAPLDKHNFYSRFQVVRVRIRPPINFGRPANRCARAGVGMRECAPALRWEPCCVRNLSTQQPGKCGLSSAQARGRAGRGESAALVRSWRSCDRGREGFELHCCTP